MRVVEIRMLIHFLPQKKSSIGQSSGKCIFCSLFAPSHPIIIIFSERIYHATKLITKSIG